VFAPKPAFMRMLIENMNIESTEYFQVGSVVSCTTCFGQKLQGEVMAFDRQTKMLSIKNPSTTGRQGTLDINLINMNMVSACQVIKEATDSPPPLSNLNYAKLQSRAMTALNEKHRAVMSVGIGVTPNGQRLFNTIAKTIDEIKWGGKELKEILIMSQVTIAPPYGTTDVRGKEGQALNHVRKVVDKFYRDQEKREAAAAGGNEAGASSSAGSSESSKSNTPTPPSLAMAPPATSSTSSSALPSSCGGISAAQSTSTQVKENS